MEFAIEVLRLKDDGTTDRLMYRQVFGEDFDLSRAIAGVNGITTRKRAVKPEAKKKAREVVNG